jgi:hypothetical protein
MTAPHDAPTAAQLVEAVREFLEGDVMAVTAGRDSGVRLYRKPQRTNAGSGVWIGPGGRA